VRGRVGLWMAKDGRLQKLVAGVTRLAAEEEDMVSQRAAKEEAVVIGVEGGGWGWRGSALDG